MRAPTRPQSYLAKLALILSLLAAGPLEPPILLFLGDSLTAGLGLNPEQSFPNLVGVRIKARGWEFKVVNAGLSGETSAGGLRRIGWLLRRPVDVMVLELGANDGLRGIPPKNTRDNLQGIIDQVRASNAAVRIVLAGMMVPPNLGTEYSEQFRAIFPELAEANELTLIPFLLEGVGGRPHLNLPDGIHPNAEGHRIVAETVWESLEPVLSSITLER